MDEDLKLLTVPELSKILRMTTQGVYAMIKRGEIPAFKLGHRWFVRQKALILALEHMEADNTPLDSDELKAMAFDVPDVPADSIEMPAGPIDVPPE